MTQRSNLISGREVTEIREQNPLLGRVLQRFVNAFQTIARNTGVSPLGESSAPPSIGGVNVKASKELVHVTIDDENPISKPVEWFLEHSVNDQTFSNPHVTHLMSARGAVLSLPTFQDDAETKNTYYFRAYSQYPGSQPSAPVYYGGATPIGTTLDGSTALTLLRSTGSGTANPSGSQGAWGRGKVLTRPSQGPRGTT